MCILVYSRSITSARPVLNAETTETTTTEAKITVESLGKAWFVKIDITVYADLTTLYSASCWKSEEDTHPTNGCPWNHYTLQYQYR
jgi:hypothetical protein